MIHYTHFLRSLRKVANIYKVSKSTLSRWLRGTGHFRQQRKGRIEERVYSAIRTLVQTNANVSLADIKHHLRTTNVFNRSISSIQKAVRKAGVTRKRLSQIAEVSPQNETVYAAQKTLFENNFNKIISIDETCFYSTDHSRYGYAFVGKRARICVSKKRMSRTKVSLLLATSSEQVIGFKVFVGSCDSNMFAEFIRSLPNITGSTLLMDNVAFHKTRAVRAQTEAKGASIFFTPPYSPWYNPVETTFAILKHRFRQQLKDCTSVTPCQLFAIVQRIMVNLSTCGSFNHVLRLLHLTPTEAQFS